MCLTGHHLTLCKEVTSNEGTKTTKCGDFQSNVSLSSRPPEALVNGTSFNVVPKIYWVIYAGRIEKERRRRKETAEESEDICMLGCLAKKIISKIIYM